MSRPTQYLVIAISSATNTGSVHASPAVFLLEHSQQLDPMNDLSGEQYWDELADGPMFDTGYDFDLLNSVQL